MTTTEASKDTLTIDQTLATTAMLLLKRGHVSTAALLTSVERQVWNLVNDDWGRSYYSVILVVPFDLLDAFDEETLELLKDTMNTVGEGYDEVITTLRVAPAAVGGDWKAAMMAALEGQISNHGVLAPLTPSHPSLDRLNFRDMAELTVYKELKRSRKRYPSARP